MFKKNSSLWLIFCLVLQSWSVQAAQVAITSPANEAIVQGDVDIAVSASSDIVRIELLADGNVVATDNTPPFAFSWNTHANALPTPVNPSMHFGYYYVDWKGAYYGPEVNSYTNLYIATLDNYDSGLEGDPLLDALDRSLARAVVDGLSIHLRLSLNNNRYWELRYRILDTAAPYRKNIVRIELFDEPHDLGWRLNNDDWTAENVSRFILGDPATGDRGYLYELQIRDLVRPLGIVYRHVDLPSAVPPPSMEANGLNWIGIEAYLDGPGNIDPQVNADDLLRRLRRAVQRVPPNRDIVIVMMAYERLNQWVNKPDTLRDLQIPAYIVAAETPDVVSLNMFAYARPGGTRDKPLLKTSHRMMAEKVLGTEIYGAEVGRRTLTIRGYTAQGDSVTKGIVVTVRGGGGGGCTTLFPAPEPYVPIGCTGDTSPGIAWSSVPGASHYKLYIGDVTDPDPDNEFQVFYDNVTGTSTSMSLPSERRYRWKVKAQTNTCDGNFTESLYFTISAVCQPPTEPPVPIGPVGCVDAARPMFTWTAVPGATSYRIVVTPSDRDDFFIDRHVTGTSLVSPVALPPRVQYRFKVRAINDAGIGPWSNGMEFTPFCGGVATTISAPLGCSTQTPTFSWAPVAPAIEYWLLVSDNIDFSAPGTTWFINHHLTDTSYAPGISFAPGQYYAKVKTLLDPSSTTAAAWSAAVSFTTSCPPPPDEIQLLELLFPMNPANGAVVMRQLASDGAPEIYQRNETQYRTGSLPSMRNEFWLNRSYSSSADFTGNMDWVSRDNFVWSGVAPSRSLSYKITRTRKQVPEGEIVATLSYTNGIPFLPAEWNMTQHPAPYVWSSGSTACQYHELIPLAATPSPKRACTTWYSSTIVGVEQPCANCWSVHVRVSGQMLWTSAFTDINGRAHSPATPDNWSTDYWLGYRVGLDGNPVASSILTTETLNGAALTEYWWHGFTP